LELKNTEQTINNLSIHDIKTDIAQPLSQPVPRISYFILNNINKHMTESQFASVYTYRLVITYLQCGC